MQSLGNDIYISYEESETSNASTTQPFNENETFERDTLCSPSTFLYNDYFCLSQASSNMLDSEELRISQTSLSVHNHATPIVSLLNSDGKTKLSLLPLDNISICNSTPRINDIATPLMPPPISGRNISVEFPIPSLELFNEVSVDEDANDLTKLKNIRLSNVNRLIVALLNINSLRNKLDVLVGIVSGKLDIFVLTETKLNETFPKNQFLIDGFIPPFRLDRNGYGGGVMIYVREGIPCKILDKHSTPEKFEGICLEVNIRKRKWLLFGGYNPSKDMSSIF